jgi:hypothetical protein
MATGQWLSLLDLARRIDPQGKIDFIAEMLSQANEFYDDIVWQEGNEIGGHKFTFRTAIPPGAWRSYLQGIPYSASKTAQATVSVGSLEAYSQIDRMQAEDSGNPERYRYSEDVAFMEGMSQTMAQTFMYGNSVTLPQQFMGLSPFYNTVNTATAQNAGNVLDALGTGSSNASMWMLGWGERTIYGIYPRGSKAGLTFEDKGDTVPGFDSLGNRFEAYTSWFRWQAGLCPMDWRYGARVCNIDTTTAGLAGSNAYDIFAGLAQLMYLFPTLGRGQSGITQTDAPSEPSPGIRTKLYMNRTLRHWADVQAIRDRNVLLSSRDYAGAPIETFRGIEVRTVDQLLVTEARVT